VPPGERAELQAELASYCRMWGQVVEAAPAGRSGEGSVGGLDQGTRALILGGQLQGFWLEQEWSCHPRWRRRQGSSFVIGLCTSQFIQALPCASSSHTRVSIPVT
jgi:hypothetical protein